MWSCSRLPKTTLFQPIDSGSASRISIGELTDVDERRHPGDASLSAPVDLKLDDPGVVALSHAIRVPVVTNVADVAVTLRF